MKTHSGHLLTMKPFQETEDRQDRKVIKSQVEKRRRERMNCSLEHLRTMLLQEPQHLSGAQGRVEKAEILEHTILFLQKTVKGDKSRAGEERGQRGGQKKSFQDGFSSCLQRAAHFLGPQGKGPWLTAALDTYFAAHVAQRSDSDSSVESSCSSGSLTRTKSILRMLRQKSKHGVRTQTTSISASLHPYARRRPVLPASPRVSSLTQTQSRRDVRATTSAGSKQSLTQNGPVTQTLWRPWP
ncbi:transcription factor HES-2-like HES-4-A-like [Solea senegalensis]|uniref:Transcription factor HES-2-like HES-4-A-like n=1 Tax=Solea senegalensis TaxID=28829 RepID=A0AAV6PV26_SOLSE|nr:transcription factor HES-7.1-A-like [Solea senegalensis]KAG7475298.1 transcription factor HES-2-like HES-4-A-like [Solea senegalensis]